MIVRLETSDGGFVGYFTAPPFTLTPKIVVWGERTFLFHDDEELPDTDRDPRRGPIAVYREEFAPHIVTERRDTP